MFFPHSVRARSAAAVLGVLVALGAAVATIVWEPWHGPTLLSISSAHGVAAGDLLAVPLVAIALAIGRRGRVVGRGSVDGGAARCTPVGWAGPASAIVLGVLLVGVGIVGVAERGAMAPSGGGTLDDTVRYAAAPQTSPVGEWTHLAVTYDGTRLRLSVNARTVATSTASGTVQATADPLWIGGDEPFGEYFDGAIDEVRIYDRALQADELRAVMATPVAPGTGDRSSDPAGARALETDAPAPSGGLVGAFAFDEGAGESVADTSGNRNAGTVIGASWAAQGRYGSALRFDGAGDRVRIAPSAALDLRGAFTLSAWVRPAAWQRGWRVIVYRETDVYFLTASSDVEAFGGRADDLLAGSIIVAACWFVTTTLTGGGRWLGPRCRWRVAGGALLLVGLVVDAALAPYTSSATLIGTALVVAWFAATARAPAEAVAGWLVSTMLAAATVASLAGWIGTGALVQRDSGGVARATALGVALLVLGLVRLRADPVPRDG